VNASVEPGDSGGPLVDASGAVIGLITAASSGASHPATDVGFALPINAVRRVANEILSAHGGPGIILGPTPYLGVVGQTIVEPDQSSEVGVLEVVAGSPGDKAGIHPGEIIRSFDGQGVTSSNDLVSLIDTHRVGDVVRIGLVDGPTSRIVKLALGSGPTA
jgi:S1-C subfamily serine protease